MARMAALMTDTWAGLRPHNADAVVPWWYERIIGAFASAVVGFGLSGLVLALIGWFRVGPGLALGFALTYSLYAQWFRLRERQRLPQRAEAAAAVAVFVALLSLLFNWTAAGETYLTDTESGVMVNAARHLDTDGSLTVDAAQGPFADARVGFVADGFTGSGVGGTLRSDVPHLVPVYRGIAGWFGQTPLLAVGALFGAAALLALYWLAVRFVSAWSAVAVTAVVAVTMPFVYATRVFLPEVVVLFCVLAALGLLWGQSETRDLWRGAIVGMLGGMAVLARPEWAVIGIAIGLFVVSELVESTRLTWLAGRDHRRFLAALVGGFAVPVLLSVADASRTSVDLPRTFEPQRALTAVLLAAAVFGPALLWWHAHPVGFPSEPPPIAQAGWLLTADAGVPAPDAPWETVTLPHAWTPAAGMEAHAWKACVP